MRKVYFGLLGLGLFFQTGLANANFILCVSQSSEGEVAVDRISILKRDSSLQKDVYKDFRFPGEWKLDKQGRHLLFIVDEHDAEGLKEKCKDTILRNRGEKFQFLKMAANPSQDSADTKDYPMLFETDYHKNQISGRTKMLQSMKEPKGSFEENTLKMASDWTRSADYHDSMVPSILEYLEKHPSEAKRIEGYSQTAETEAKAAGENFQFKSVDPSEKVVELVQRFKTKNERATTDFDIVVYPFAEGSSHGLKRGSFNVFTNLMTDSFKPEDQKRKKATTLPLYQANNPCHQKTWVLAESIANLLTLKGFLYSPEELNSKRPELLENISTQQEQVLEILQKSLSEMEEHVQDASSQAQLKALIAHLDDVIHMMFLPNSQ